MAKYRRKPKMSHINRPDERHLIKAGDRAAVCWYDDPTYYEGVVEEDKEGLFIRTPAGPGYLHDADHVIKSDCR